MFVYQLKQQTHYINSNEFWFEKETHSDGWKLKQAIFMKICRIAVEKLLPYRRVQNESLPGTDWKM